MCVRNEDDWSIEKVYRVVEEKWVVAPENVSFTVEEIEKLVYFQEQ